MKNLTCAVISIFAIFSVVIGSNCALDTVHAKDTVQAKTKTEAESANPKTIEEQFPAIASQWKNSLHYTGEGMRSHYERHDGFMALAHIPYDKLGCKNCHASTCADCHGVKQGQRTVFSAEKPKDNATCLRCHSRAGAMLKLDHKAKTPGVHVDCGVKCVQCHTLHPKNPKTYSSMRNPGATAADCMDCHKEGADGPELDMSLAEHAQHNDDLHCNACHVSNAVTCYNCHFDEFMRTKKRAGNFMAPVKSCVFLLNYLGKVTSGNVQTMVSKGKKFIAYAPYYTHSVRGQGRTCDECHGVEAATKLDHGDKLTVTSYEQGKLKVRCGIIPVLPELLDFVYLDKKNGQWTPIPAEDKALVQFIGHGEPLSRKQIKKLAKKQK